MTAAEVLDWLRGMRKEVGQFDQTTYRDDRWVRWHNEMRSTLRRVFGEDSHEYKEYGGVSGWGRPIAGIGQAAIDAKSERKFDEILSAIRGWLEALILQVERFGIRSEEKLGQDEEPASEPTTATPVVPKRYRYTSPVYLAESVWSACGWITHWVIDHKIPSIVIIGVTFVASILTILAFTGVIEA